MRDGAGATAVGMVAVASVLVALGACSRGDDDPVLQGDVPTTEVSETGDRTTSTTAPSATTTEPACPAVQRYLGDDDAEGEGDVDGDGRPDFVQSFPTAPDSTTVTLLVELAAGGGATVELPSDHVAPTVLLGAEVLDAGSGGQDVLWVRVGAGASTTIVGLYRLDGCALETATFENGDPVELPIGGTVSTASGARCGSLIDDQADLLVYEATHITDRDYEIVTSEYRWQDGQLVRSPESAPTVTRSDDVSEVSTFECGDVSV